MCGKAFFRFSEKVESVSQSRPVQWDKHTLVMKNWLHIITLAVTYVLIVSQTFAQEGGGSEQPVAVHSEEVEVMGEVLPTMDEIERRKAFLELRKQEIALEKEERGKGAWLGRIFPPGMGLQMVMPFAAFVFVLAILSIIFGYERKKDRNRHETIRAYLERGIEVPIELLIDEDHPHAKKPTSDIRKGVIWLCVGIGISLAVFILNVSLRSAAIGLIPVFIGIGYIVAARLDTQDNENNG